MIKMNQKNNIEVHCFSENGTIFVLTKTSNCTSNNLVGSSGYPGYPRDPESLDLVIMSPPALVLSPRSVR